jgi:hypothetical protein
MYCGRGGGGGEKGECGRLHLAHGSEGSQCVRCVEQFWYTDATFILCCDCLTQSLLMCIRPCIRMTMDSYFFCTVLKLCVTVLSRTIWLQAGVWYVDVCVRHKLIAEGWGSIPVHFVGIWCVADLELGQAFFFCSRLVASEMGSSQFL